MKCYDELPEDWILLAERKAQIAYISYRNDDASIANSAAGICPARADDHR